MRISATSFLLIILLASVKLPAQQPSYQKLDKKYFKSYFTDSWEIIKSPLSWEDKDWLKAGLIGGAGFLIFTQDKAIRDFFGRNNGHFGNQVSEYLFHPLGYGLYTMPVLGGLYLYGAIGEHPATADFALQGIKVIVVSGAFVQIIKQTTHRHRPHQDTPANPRNWDGPFSNIHYTSFPSGHTAAAFATACFLSEYFKDKKWVPWLSYTLASGVGLSRINDDEHWASDVFAGAILGYYIARFLMRSKNIKFGLSMLPGGHAGLGLTYRL